MRNIDITDIIDQGNIIKTSYEFGVSDADFYTAPVMGIGVCTIILLIALIAKKHRWSLVTLGIVSLIFSFVYGYAYSMNHTELVSTTYSFKAGSKYTVEKVEKYIGEVSYDENHDIYTVTQYNRKDR